MQQVTDKEFRALITLLDDNDKEIFSHVSDKLFSLGVEGNSDVRICVGDHR